VPWNDSHFSHKRFNELLVAGRAELDDAKRREIYFEMQKILSDEGGTVVPMFANYVMGLSDKVKHDVMGANWSMDGFRCVERWWFG
jgi:peptide/nickel transport system substrate-binding protein